MNEAAEDLTKKIEIGAVVWRNLRENGYDL